MAINFEDILPDVSYIVDIEGHTYEVEGSMILSATCPSCKGSGQKKLPGKPPDICSLCNGLGMFDYSQARAITPV